jgi:uncharacterized protein YbjT (DUF2867 family)
MFVIAGVTGNTGKVVAETLLAQKKPVRVIVRDAKKGEPWKAKGAEVAIAELDDQKALTDALRGAEGAYLLIPPNWTAKNVLAENKARAQTIAKAVEASGVKHVVFLSSIAAHLTSGTGPVVSAHDGEVALGKTKADVTSVRAAYFMENFGSSLHALGEGKFPTFINLDSPMPMIATHDIGIVAAKALLEGGKGKQVIELEGPKQYSQRDVAAALSRLTKKTIEAQQGPEEMVVPALTSAGVPAAWVPIYQEMTHALNEGVFVFEGKGATHVKGTTPLESVLEKLLASGAKGH